MLEPGVKIVRVLVTQSCPTLWDPMIYSLPGSSVQGILRAIGKWIAIPFSRSARPRDETWVSCVADSLPSELEPRRLEQLYDFLPYHFQGVGPLFSQDPGADACVGPQVTVSLKIRWMCPWGQWCWLCVLSPHSRGGNQVLDERKPRSGCCWRGPEFLVRPGREAEPLFLRNWKHLRVIRVQEKLLLFFFFFNFFIL